MRINTELLSYENVKLTEGFYSGNSFLDNFLKSPDAFDDGIGKTFVWIDDLVLMLMVEKYLYLIWEIL